MVQLHYRTHYHILLGFSLESRQKAANIYGMRDPLCCIACLDWTLSWMKRRALHIPETLHRESKDKKRYTSNLMSYDHVILMFTDQHYTLTRQASVLNNKKLCPVFIIKAHLHHKCFCSAFYSSVFLLEAFYTCLTSGNVQQDFVSSETIDIIIKNNTHNKKICLMSH